MKTGCRNSTSALVIAAMLAAPMGSVARAQSDAPALDLDSLSQDEITAELQRLKQACDAGEDAPGGFDCAIVSKMLEEQGAAAQEQPAEEEPAQEEPAQEETAPEDTAPEAATEAPAPADPPPAEPAPDAEAETEAETEADAAAESEPEPDAETEAEADAEAETEAEADAATETEAETQADAETLGQSDAAERDTAPEPRPEPSPVEAAEETEADAEEPQSDVDAAPEETTEAEPEPMDSEAQARAEAEQAASSSAAAAAQDGAEDSAEVIEETVTSEEVRGSDENFETDVTESGEDKKRDKKKAKKKDDDDDEGLSDLQKAAILGFGAVALSQILKGDERVVSNSGDRVVVEDNGQYRVLRNDDALLRRPGAEVTTYRYDDGSTRNVVVYADGTDVETIRAADGRVLRRTRVLPDGERVVLFDDTRESEEVVINDLPQSDDTRRLNFRDVSEDDLAAALAAQNADTITRSFSLSQVRNIDRVRKLVPEISIDTINFETGSAAIRPVEARDLAGLGNEMRRMIEANPAEVFLIEGHTDAVGPWSYNLALSDRRAESVALALTEYFDVPPANMVLQGYGEADLAIETDTAERRNRRAAVRRITPLLQGR